MARKSLTTGFRCTAIWDGQRCTGMMDTKKTVQTEHATIRYRKCRRCKSRQRTCETPNDKCHQPKTYRDRQLLVSSPIFDIESLQF